MSRVQSGLYAPKPRPLVLRDLLNRTRKRFDTLSDDQLAAVLEDALYQERLRLEKSRHSEPEEHERLDRLARALVHGGRSDWTHCGMELVHAWSDEIHGKFDPRAYRFATKILPKAMGGLLSARPSRLRDWSFDLGGRVKVQGDLAFLRELASEATLILAPTHVSNLDSPLIGFALHQAGLPPFVYGAGLNLFSNPVMGWWMSRLGAYTVDRTKRASLYKDVLKDYSVRCLTTRHHSLFFPGGTRARSGEVETHLKKGLLGTGIVAWQEMLDAGRKDSEVYVVPLTLSFQLVLEASTLIEDHLAEAGKQRYIISDDEFAQASRIAAFADRVLELDDTVVCHFGQPLNTIGNVVPRDAAERTQWAEAQRRYVTHRDGQVEWDDQRDRVYTERLSQALIREYPKGAVAMVTHVAATAAWELLSEQVGSTDPFRLVRTPPERRDFARHEFIAALGRVVDRVRAGAAAGAWLEYLPASPDAVLDVALDRFSRYHKTRALAAIGNRIQIQDAELCLYYRNRLRYTEAAS